ncbi:hypothetical protein Sste5346_001208 [Sporothrix stenoceras]|uniref:Rhodopsin domain-containing protein n=1 Tax=Sporothrix stenoceras TaxID=5173 RepID=A0ABR3ZPY4_9PEZI
MLGWDDLTIVLVAILSAARLGCQIAQVHYGDGRHRYFIESEDYETANRLGWYALLLFFVAICLMKISICLLLLRIKNERWLRWLIYGMMAGLVLTNGGVVVILLAECRPVNEYWDDVGSCWDPRVRVFSIYLTIGYAILTDLLCSCLPLVVIWKVRIPLKSKLLICGLMSLGLLATGCGIGRAASLTVLTTDFTWAFCITEIWANCELFVGIIAANLALSRSIYIYFFEDNSSAHSGSGGGGGGAGGNGANNGAVGSGPTNGPSSGPAQRLSFYGYQSHGLTFFNNLHVPWSWRSKSWRYGRGRNNISSNTGSIDRQHVFRRQSSYSPSRMVSSDGSRSQTATMETAATATGSRSLSAHFTRTVRRLAESISHNVFFWRHRSMASIHNSSTDTATSATSQEKGKAVIVGVTPVHSHDGSVTMVDGVILPDSDSVGHRGSVVSEVVITGGRGRALDRDREHGHTRNGRSISSSTTVTSRRRSSLYYHHHLSKQHPYGGSATTAKPWSSTMATAEAASASNDSGLPAGTGIIKKRTEFWISEEELDRADFDDDNEEAFVGNPDGNVEKMETKDEPSGKDKGAAAERALEYVTLSASPPASLQRNRSISNASTATAVDTHGDADVSSTSGMSTNHNNGSEVDLELGLHPPPRAHLS